MSPGDSEGRPLAGAARNAGNTDIHKDTPNPDHAAHLAAIRERSPKAIGGCHAVLVFQPDDRYQRRLYLSLHAADAAMQRAAERGLTSSCVLVELVPVTAMPVIVVGGGDHAA